MQTDRYNLGTVNIIPKTTYLLDTLKVVYCYLAVSNLTYNNLSYYFLLIR